jgi:hypothetical protein
MVFGDFLALLSQRVPARLVHHAGQVTLRLPPGRHLLARVLARLRRLPGWT